MTLLTELMPIPKRKASKWGYKNLSPQFKNRNDYISKVKPKRISLLKRLARRYKPLIVVAYGKSCWDDYKKIFPDVVFRREDIFEVGSNKDTFVILIPHFVSRSMNGKLNDVVTTIRHHVKKSQLLLKD